MPITDDEFRSALSRFASGVTVVTTRNGAGELFGITVSAFCSVSLEPPLVLICIEKATASHSSFLESGIFIVNILARDQAELSERFASQIADKFAGVGITLNIDGLPMIDGSLAIIECRVKQALHGGDHTIFVGEVDRAKVHEGDPLIYFRSDYHRIPI